MRTHSEEQGSGLEPHGEALPSSPSPDRSEAYDAIIIGSGLGGLSSASTLSQLAGMKCLIIEQHWVPGGMTHQFQRPGGHWFTCGTHYVGQMGDGSIMRRLMDFVTGGTLWDPLPDEFDRFCFKSDGAVYTQPTGTKAWEKRLISHFPHEKQAILQYFEDIKSVYKWYDSYFLGRATGGWVSRAMTAWTSKQRCLYAAQTCQQYMDRTFADEKLKGVLCALWGDYGLLPNKVTFMQHALVAGNNFEGTWYPRLGSRALAKGALGIIQRAGGQVLLSTRALEILRDDGGAAIGVLAEDLASGQRRQFHAPIVISAAGAYNTYRRLLQPPLHQELESKELRHAGQAVISVWLCLDASPAELWGMAGENYWISSHYQHDAEGLYHPEIRRVHYAFLSCSGLKERYSSHAHGLEICLFTNPEFFDSWKGRSASEYAKMKARIVEDAVNFVDQFVPGLAGHITASEVGTPVTWERFCQWPGGTMYGVPPTGRRLEAEAFLRPHTPIKNLWLAGCDANVFGLAGAMLGGFMAAGLVLRPVLGCLSFLPTVARIVKQPDWARPIWPADAFPLVLQRREARGCAAALLTFRVQGGANAPPDAISFAAGQYLPLLMEIDRSEVRRCYSICSTPDKLPEIQLLVKRVQGGMASPFLIDDLPIGATIHAQPPRGSFVLRPITGDRPGLHVFVGAGSGLAPLLPMLEGALAGPDSALLVGCHRSPEEEVLVEEVGSIVRQRGTKARAAPRFRWRRHYSSLSGRIEREELAMYVRMAARQLRSGRQGDAGIDLIHCYVCGPKHWMALVREALVAAGVPPAHIGEESFASAESGFQYERAGVRCERRTIALAFESGHSQCVTVAPGQTILDAAEAAMVTIPAACRSGNCGSCRATLRAGEVLDMEDGLLAQPGLSVRTCRVTPANEGVILSLS